jgi:hypothetical protein
MKRIFLVIVYVLIVFSKDAAAQEIYYPVKFVVPYSFKTIETEHFNIHYQSNLEKQAKYLSVVSERIHRELSVKEKWKPHIKTDVILVDTTDSANGFSLANWRNTIVMYITPPSPTSSINSYDDWLTLLFVHEYTHTLNIDQVHGVPQIIRYLFGRRFFPNGGLPIFYIEGNAVYNESLLTGFGRIENPYSEMVLRMDFLSGKNKSLNEAAHFPNRWPFGQVPYLYGGYFLHYLAEKFGEDDVKEFYKNYSDNYIPFFVNRTAVEVFGKSFDSLWNEWTTETLLRYTQQKREIQKNGLTPLKKITKDGVVQRSPRFINNRIVYYYSYNGVKNQSINSIDINTGNQKKITKTHSPSAIAVGENNSIYTTDVEVYNAYNNFNEIFTFDGSYTQLTEKLRTSYLDIHKNKLVYIAQESGEFSLVLSNIKNLKIKKTLIKKGDVQLYHCRFSPSGDKVVFGYKINERSGIAVYDIEAESAVSVVEDTAHNIFPLFDNSSRSIYYSSDKNGVFNLYRLDIRNGIADQISNVIGGIFSFDLSPDGKKIILSGYSENGFDLYQMDITQKIFNQHRFVSSLFRQEQAAEFKEKPRFVQSTDYSPPKHFFPPLVTPILYSEEIGDSYYDLYLGASLFMSDPLAHHAVSLQGAAGTTEEKVNVGVSYTYGELYPALTLFYYDNTLFYGDDNYPYGSRDTDLQRRLAQQAGGIISFPLIKYDYSALFSFYYLYEKENVSTYIESSDRTYNNEVYNSHPGFSASVSTLSSTPFTPVSHSGVVAATSNNYYTEYLGADNNYFSTFGYTGVYSTPLLLRSVASITGRYGYIHAVDTTVKSFSLGRYKSSTSESLIFNEQSLGLRGYPAGSHIGSYLATGTVDLSLPLFISDFGYSLLPVFVRSLYTTPFVDAGSVWSYDSDPELNYSAGLELTSLITVAYRYDIRLFYGYAHGFTNLGEDQFYFGIRSLLYNTLNSK